MLSSRSAFRVRAALSASSLSRCDVTSRETDSSLVTFPSRSVIGETVTSHHFGVPLAVGAKPEKWAVLPSFASVTASAMSALPPSGQSLDQATP
jgi:hypothetical protein